MSVLGPALQGGAALEYLQLRRSRTYAGAGVPRGDGSAVILASGFGMTQGSLAVLAGWLQLIGYEPVRADLGRNAGCSNAMARRLETRVARACERSGRRVAIVGHSRGGQLARVVAGRRPDLVSAVVTLGSPLSKTNVSALLRAVGGGLVAASAIGIDGLVTRDCLAGTGCCNGFWAELEQPLAATVSLTQIWSKRDGVVAVAGARPSIGGVQVDATHLGMICNRQAFAAIGRALAQRPSDEPRVTRLGFR